MSIPLVQKPEKDDINTSIIAIKRNIERINMLLGLVDNDSPDLSGFATKQELQDAVTELQPVDEVTVGNMHSVSSNAVARAIDSAYGDWFLLQDISTSDVSRCLIYAKQTLKEKFIHLHFEAYLNNTVFSIGYAITNIPEYWRPQTTKRGIIDADLPNGRTGTGIDIYTNGNISLYPQIINQYTGNIQLGGGFYGDATIIIT